MRIGEFSQHCGESIDTLRYYGKLGLLNPKRRKKQRFYSKDDLKRIIIIKKLKKMNFKLAEIKMILQLDSKIDEGLESGQVPMVTIDECLALFQNNLKIIERKEKEIREIKEVFLNIIKKIVILKETVETD